jgi:predicted outer membrane repeat protein
MATAPALGGGSVIRVPADQATIQDGINAALAGDEVVVSAGTYNETINFLGKAITVRGDSGNPADTIIDGGSSGTSTVTCAMAETSSTRLIGLTVTGGVVGLSGGGVFINNASPTVSNCRIVSNSAGSGGGGIVVTGGSPVIENCTFQGNSTPGNGGGIYITSGTPTVESCTFQSNTASVGGAISAVTAAANVIGCTFWSNSAGLGGALSSDGGAATTILNCGFFGNTGSGMASRGGAISNRSTVMIANCVFSGNSANHGGAVTNENAAIPQMINCTFYANSATTAGGTINAESATPIFVNCIFGNSSPDLAFQQLGAITTLVHCNTDTGWGGLGTNNTSVDPMFADPDGVDDLTGTPDDDLTLRFGSLCIDIGDDSSLPADTTDLDSDLDVAEDLPQDMLGQERVKGAAVDLGAYEFHPDGHEGGGPGESVGIAVAAVGDVNGDAIDDYVVGAPKFGADRGKVYVYDGATGAQLWARIGQADGDEFGRAVAGAGDLDMDGRPEVIVGAPYNDNGGGNNAGRVYVYDGQTGGLIISRLGAAAGDRFGWSLAGGVDVDDDGVSDVIVGAPHNDDNGNLSGEVTVYSGADASVIMRFNGVAAGDRLGWAVAALGDVDGDAHGDFAMSAPWNDHAAGNAAGRVYIVAGATGQVRHEVLGEAQGDRLGWSIAALGRVNGDAFDDLAIGAPYHDRVGGADAGRVYVVSGATGATLFSRSDQPGSSFGIAVAAAGDANCDGAADVVVGGHRRDNSRGADAGRVRVISGADGSTLDYFDGLVAGDKLGRSVASLGDTDADGMVELLAGTPGAGSSGEGAAYILHTVIECLPASHGPAGPDPSLADLDGDGLVRGADVLKAMAGLGGPGAGDVDGDGVVSAADVAFIIDQLGSSEADR